MRLSVPGRHMALNALGALLAATEIGAPADRLLDGLAGFEGVRRRFELIGTAASVRVFDDYAHHPTEVSATLEAVRTLLEQTGAGRSLVVFQPHLYSRTKAFAAEFGRALDGADQVFVLDVYGAREQPIAGVSGASVAEHVSVPVQYLPDFSSVADGGGRGRRAGRRRRHHGRRRRHHARARDRDRAAGAGQPQRSGAAGGVVVTEPDDVTAGEVGDDPAARNRR